MIKTRSRSDFPFSKNPFAIDPKGFKQKLETPLKHGSKDFLISSIYLLSLSISVF